MKRTFSKYQLKVTLINPDNRQFFDETVNTPFSDLEKAKKDYIKHGFYKKLVPFDFELIETEGKTYTMSDGKYIAISHFNKRSSDTMYKTFKVCKGFYRYVALDSNITFRVDCDLPIKRGDALEVALTRERGKNHFVYSLVIDETTATEKQYFCSDDTFIKNADK